MAQEKRCDVSDRLWLTSLVESFDKVSCDETRRVPCDQALLRATHDFLSGGKARRDSETCSRLTEAA
ncbi:hypothetical protein [Rhodopseudomonas pseudopalustris]|uniref:Uncharacterized protein n=1 Tax=Rhodopseudomonas palustris (strain BisB5) TaxID=316057 RepID=Q135M3_RHOPS|nr:hypothetical protein [Rhodopseudomonas pseudopalustris]ABE40216.1 hypothetical protein RPD_2990 [Rhodopseudomonas palustris BisB5]